MKIKSFQLVAFSFLAFTIGFFAKTSASFAGDQVLTPLYTVADETTRVHLEHYCGTWDNTSQACNQDYLDCYNAFNAIDNNMYSVCDQRKDVCRYDVSSITMPEEMYINLYRIPVDNFRNNPTINVLDNCRAQHPKSEDAAKAQTQAQIDEENRLREAELGKPRGEAPAPAADAAPVVNDAAQVVEAPQAAQNADVENTGGCSLQFSKSPANTLHIMIAFLLVILPFTMSSIGGDRSKRK